MKQKSTALSSCESEYMAACEAGKEAVWLRRLYTLDLGYEDLSYETKENLTEESFRGSKPITIMCDSTGAICLSKNPVRHKSSKHIELRVHWIRDAVKEGLFRLSKIDTKLNASDYLGKLLDVSKFKRTLAFLTNSSNAVAPKLGLASLIKVAVEQLKSGS